MRESCDLNLSSDSCKSPLNCKPEEKVKKK